MKYLFTALLISYCFVSYGQQPATTVKKAQNVYFYKTGHKEVSTKDSADFIQVVTVPDSGETLYTVHEYYKNENLKFLGKSSKVHPVVFQGQCISYYPNGHKKFVADYSYNTPTGKTYRFYPNGKPYIFMDLENKVFVGDNSNRLNSGNDSTFVAVYDSAGNAILENGNGYYKRYNDDFKIILEEGTVKNSLHEGIWKGYDNDNHITYTENYGNGKLLSGMSVDSAGKTYQYTERNIEAKFPGGMEAMGKFFSKNMVYPVSVRGKGIQGRVICQFSIAPDGKPYDFKILRSLHPVLDEEALKALSKMPIWSPDIYLGKPVKSIYTIPLSYTIN